MPTRTLLPAALLGAACWAGPAGAEADPCGGIAVDADWASCVRRATITPDARLNLAYRRLFNKLKDSGRAIPLRDAQRQWLVFRDAQCKAEAAPGSTAPAACLERLTAVRGDELLASLAGRKGDVPEPARSDAAPSSGFRFASPNLLEGYAVSGLWFPDKVKPYAGLSGRAVFRFVDKREGRGSKTFTVAINGAGLLTDEFWAARGVADPSGFDAEALLDKLRGVGTIEIPLSAETRATVGPCDETAPGKAHPGANRCLHLGSAAVDIQELGFDGRKELIFRQPGEAQRFSDAFKVVDLPDEGPPFIGKLRTDAPLGDLDGLSTIDLTSRRIILAESNGACASATATYAIDRKLGPGLQLVSREQYVTDPDGSCHVDGYVAVRRPDGQGSTLKLRSRTPVR